MYVELYIYITTTNPRFIFWVVLMTFPPITLRNNMRNKITRNDKGGGGNNEPIHHCDTNKNRKQKLMSNFRQKKILL